MNKSISLAIFGALLFFTAFSEKANSAVEIVLDESPLPLDSLIYDSDDQVIHAVPQDVFTCNGPEAQLGDGLILLIDDRQIRLATARFSRSGDVTRILATTPGELPTCGPEGLIFQDQYR